MMSSLPNGQNRPGYKLAPIVCISALFFVIGCSPIPRQYLREAVPNVTLSALVAAPHTYQGRLVVLGAVIVKEDMRDGVLWLHVKNRPLDEEYRPQLPPSPDDPEGGWYWIVVEKHQTFPSSYHHWADMTVVGRVTGVARDKAPILKMVYVRGWGMTRAHDGVWEHEIDANYTFTTPPGIRGELGQ